MLIELQPSGNTQAQQFYAGANRFPIDETPTDDPESLNKLSGESVFEWLAVNGIRYYARMIKERVEAGQDPTSALEELAAELFAFPDCEESLGFNGVLETVDEVAETLVETLQKSVGSIVGRAYLAATAPVKASGDWLIYEEMRTDNMLAEKFVDQYGENFRYVAKWKKWLVWSAGRFKIDDGGQRVGIEVREMVKDLWDYVPEIGKQDRILPKTVSQIISFIRTANQAKKINDILKLAQLDRRVLVETDHLNRNRQLLNLKNGSYDFGLASERWKASNHASHAFRGHQRGDLSTQMAGVFFDPAAKCPKWEETLNLVFGDDQSLIRYVQQLLGYSLTGCSGEHILPIAFGSGNNGKSTIWNTIVGIAGDYGLLASESLLIGERSAHPTEKASLYQKRIVAISEPEQDAKLRESRVKELTGDSRITARRMHEDFWEFDRTHTFWLTTNHLPRITGTDNGIWRRIKLIPFTVDLSSKVKPVPDFHKKLIDTEGSGILNWMIAGLKDYTKNGFVEPRKVTDAIDRYKGTADELGGFVADCCEIGDGLVGTSRELFAAYQRHGGALSQTMFGRLMGNQFDSETPTSGAYRRQKIYRGLTVLPFSKPDLT